MRPYYESIAAARVISRMDYLPSRKAGCRHAIDAAPPEKGPDQYVLNPCFTFSDEEKILRQVEPDLVTALSIRQVLEQHSDLEFWSFAGQRDGIVPPELFDHERRILGDLLHYRLVPGGHDGYVTDREVLEAVFAPPQSDTGISH